MGLHIRCRAQQPGAGAADNGRVEYDDGSSPTKAQEKIGTGGKEWQKIAPSDGPRATEVEEEREKIR